MNALLDWSLAQGYLDGAVPLDSSGGTRASSTPPIVALRGTHQRDELPPTSITKEYGAGSSATTALAGVSFAARGAEFLSIVGPSGCGKTTLLKIVAGLIDAELGPDHVRRCRRRGKLRTSLVFQDHGLLPWYDVLENVALGLRFQHGDRAAARERARHFIVQVGLERFLHHHPHELSIGMRQRVGIARAFVADPRDPAARRAVRIARRADEARAAAGAAAHLAGAPEAGRARHARHRRGDPAQRPHRGHERPSGRASARRSPCRSRVRAIWTCSATPPGRRSATASGASSKKRCGRACGCRDEDRQGRPSIASSPRRSRVLPPRRVGDRGAQRLDRVAVFPPPSRILADFPELWRNDLLDNVGLTLVRFLGGVVVGAVPGIIIGLCIGWSTRLRRIVDPFIAAIHPIPKIVLFPLFIVIFGDQRMGEDRLGRR